MHQKHFFFTLYRESICIGLWFLGTFKMFHKADWWESELFFYILWKWKWHTTKYGDPYSEFVLCIYPIQSAYTQQWTHTHTHTHREHTPGAVGSHLCCSARGAVGGSVPCSRAPQSWCGGWRECCTFTPPAYNPCRPETRTRNLSITSPTL